MDPLRDHLIRLLSWSDAHAPFDAAVADVPVELRGVRPEGVPYSLWELLEHVRLAQEDLLAFCVAPSYTPPSWPDDYWPGAPAPPSPEAWDRSVAAVRADREAVARLVADADLLAAVPNGDGQTLLREVLLVADHAAYHVGQMVVVRRLLGCWDG